LPPLAANRCGCVLVVTLSTLIRNLKVRSTALVGNVLIGQAGGRLEAVLAVRDAFSGGARAWRCSGALLNLKHLSEFVLKSSLWLFCLIPYLNLNMRYCDITVLFPNGPQLAFVPLGGAFFTILRTNLKNQTSICWFSAAGTPQKIELHRSDATPH